MKKAVAVLIILFIAVLSFLAGGYFSKERPSRVTPPGSTLQPAPTDEDHTDSEESPAPGAVEVSPTKRQLIGVKVAQVEKTPMTYTLRLYGKVVPDETKTYRVNASTDCWIREIANITTGSIVQKNQVLAEALAPAYYNAQITYLIALDNMDRIRQQLGGQTRHQQADLANNQIRMAVQALQNLGITDAQTEELANTRQARPYLQVRSPTGGVVLSRKVTLNQWFKAAEEFFTVADIQKVWVYGDVYEDEVLAMRPGMAVMIKHPQTGGTFKARIGKVLPLFDQTARTLKVRIDVENPEYELRPDMFVDVEIPIMLTASVNIPAEAILDSGKKAVVYVDKGEGIFEPRKVTTGWRFGGQVEITGGLEPGEKIAVSGNFLIDSESRMDIIASGTTDMNGDSDHNMPVREKQANRRDKDRTGMPGMDRSWVDMLAPTRVRRDAKGGSVKPEQKKKGSAHKAETSPSVVDWSTSDSKGNTRDWSGWGKFPGSEYLGIKKETKKDSSPQANPAANGGEKASGK